MEHEGQLLFPAGFAVGAAGHQAAGEVDAAGEHLAAHLRKAAAHAVVVAHLAGAVIHVQHGARLQLCPAHKARQLVRSHPDGGRQGRRPAEGVVVLQQGVQAHQTAHAAAADEGVLPVGQGAEAAVDEGFEPVDIPAHGGLTLAVEVAVGGVIEPIGRILHQTLVVGACVALHRRHDQRRVGVVQIIGHAPALAVGGIFVKKHVLAVEHVQHREPAVRLGLIHGGQINVRSALLGAVDGRVAHAPFFDHGAFPSQSFLHRHPAAMQGCPLSGISLTLCRKESNCAGKFRKFDGRAAAMIQQTPPSGCLAALAKF